MTKRNKTLVFLLLVLGLCQRTIAQDSKTKEVLWTTDWSPDGKFIGVGGNLDTLKIYDARNLKLYKSIPIEKTVTRIKWHPTKNIIAVATQTSKDKPSLINLDIDERIELDGISQEGARGIDWNFSGEYLAVADNVENPEKNSPLIPEKNSPMNPGKSLPELLGNNCVTGN